MEKTGRQTCPCLLHRATFGTCPKPIQSSERISGDISEFDSPAGCCLAESRLQLRTPEVAAFQRPFRLVQSFAMPSSNVLCPIQNKKKAVPAPQSEQDQNLPSELPRQTTAPGVPGVSQVRIRAPTLQQDFLLQAEKKPQS